MLLLQVHIHVDFLIMLDVENVEGRAALQELLHDCLVSRIVDMVQWAVVDTEAVAPDMEGAIDKRRSARAVRIGIFDNPRFSAFTAKGDSATRKV